MARLWAIPFLYYETISAMAFVRQPRQESVFVNRIINRLIPLAMYLTLFFAVVAGGSVCYAWDCYRKYWRAKSEQKRLEKELAESKRESASQKEIIKSQEDELHDYKHLLTAGWRKLKVQTCVFSQIIGNIQGSVCVVGCDTRRSDLYFVVKSYTYEVGDPDGYDFAVRQAEELIEKLNE